MVASIGASTETADCAAGATTNVLTILSDTAAPSSRLITLTTTATRRETLIRATAMETT